MLVGRGDESRLEPSLPFVGVTGAFAGVGSATDCDATGSASFTVGAAAVEPWIATGACGDAVSGGIGI